MKKPNITLEEFLSGEELTYKGADWRKTQATYRSGVGIYVERDGKDLGLADVLEDRGAKRVYHNLTRRRPSAADMNEEAAT
jgi:hypothetical protein